MKTNQTQTKNVASDQGNQEEDIFKSNIEYKAFYEKSQNFEVDEAYISKNLTKSDQLDNSCLKIEDFNCIKDKTAENKRFDKFIDNYLSKEDDKKFLAKVNETFQKEYGVLFEDDIFHVAKHDCSVITITITTYTSPSIHNLL